MMKVRINCGCAAWITILVAMVCLTCMKCCAQTVTHVTLTCYQPVRSQCNNDPLTTADGSKINLHHLKNNKLRWCAVSRDLLWLFPKGKPKRILIDGYGVYLVKDVMNKRHHHRVDILIHPKDTRRISINNVKVKIL